MRRPRAVRADVRRDLATWLAAGDAPGVRPCRVAIVVAHPDDETIGLGTRLAEMAGCTLVHVTDGAPRDGRDARAHGFAVREAYAAARRVELAGALAALGARSIRLVQLGITDQQAMLALVGIARRLERLLASVAPEVVLTHAYEGGHPDHDAVAFAVHAACARLRRARGRAPAIAELASYHARGGRLRTGTFLPAPRRPIVVRVLTPPERERKARAYAAYASQQRVLEAFPIGVEQLRAAPRYRFTRPPHVGRLHYESYDWGITGERWRAHAAAALAELEVEEPL